MCPSKRLSSTIKLIPVTCEYRRTKKETAQPQELRVSHSGGNIRRIVASSMNRLHCAGLSRAKCWIAPNSPKVSDQKFASHVGRLNKRGQLECRRGWGCNYGFANGPNRRTDCSCDASRDIRGRIGSCDRGRWLRGLTSHGSMPWTWMASVRC